MTDWLTPVDIARELHLPGRCPLTDWRGTTATATFLAESGGNPRAVGKPVQVTVDGVATWGVALGIAQLFSAWHVDRPPVRWLPRLTVAECFDPKINIGRAWEMMHLGRTGWFYNMSWWDAFKPGKDGEPAPYRAHLDEAAAAVRSIGGTI